MELPRGLYEEMLAHARGQAPREACGLVAGRGGKPERFIATDNEDPQPETRYRIPPGQLLRHLRAMEERGEDLIAIFHSHPRSQAYPSATDVAQAHYPDARYLILSLAEPDRPVLRAFLIRDGRVTEEGLELA